MSSPSMHRTFFVAVAGAVAFAATPAPGPAATPAPAAAANPSSEAQEVSGPSSPLYAGSEGSEIGSSGAVYLEESADRERLAELRLASALRREALRRHSHPDLWAEAALLHLSAARLRGMGPATVAVPPDGRPVEGARTSLRDLLTAASIFYHEASMAAACGALVMAADVAGRLDEVEIARFSAEAADRLVGGFEGSQSCAGLWDEDPAEVIVPAPLQQIEVQPPDVAAIEWVEDVRLVAPVLAERTTPQPPPVRR